jgi:hypothetical protein
MASSERVHLLFERGVICNTVLFSNVTSLTKCALLFFSTADLSDLAKQAKKKLQDVSVLAMIKLAITHTVIHEDED